MEYIRIRQINGAGICYEDNGYQAEDKATLEAQHKDKDRYHDSMPGNGYAKKIWITPEYKRLKLIANLAQDKLNKEIKVTFDREVFNEREVWDGQAGGSYRERLKPVSKIQKVGAKALDINWETTKQYIHAQVRDRIQAEVLLDGVIIYRPYKKEPESEPESQYITDLIDLLTRTRIQINEITDYALLTK